MPPRKRATAPASAAARASARARAGAPRRQGSSIQTRNVSYYFTPGQGHTVTTAGGYQAGRLPGGVYRVRTPGGQQLEGKPPGLPSKTYHRIVLAEFIGTVLIIAAAPVVVPQKSSSAGSAVSVTFAGPLVRLTAVCVVFFVLALLATGQRSGKVAAAFGGLILTGAALNAGDLWKGLASAVGAGTGGTSTGPGGGLTAAQNEQASGIAPGAEGRAGI